MATLTLQTHKTTVRNIEKLQINVSKGGECPNRAIIDSDTISLKDSKNIAHDLLEEFLQNLDENIHMYIVGDLIEGAYKVDLYELAPTAFVNLIGEYRYISVKNVKEVDFLGPT